MSTRSVHSAGFSVIGIVIIIAVIGVISTAGYLVIDRNEKVSDRAAITNEADATTPKQPVAAPTAQSEQSKELDTYIIQELGIKLTVPNALKDLTHVVKDIELSNGKTSKAAYFSTTALTKEDAKCGAGNVSIAAIATREGQYPNDDPALRRDYGPLLKQFPDKFATFMTSRAGCLIGKDDKLQKLYSDTVQALIASVKTVEQTD